MDYGGETPWDAEKRLQKALDLKKARIAELEAENAELRRANACGKCGDNILCADMCSECTKVDAITVTEQAARITELEAKLDAIGKVCSGCRIRALWDSSQTGWEIRSIGDTSPRYWNGATMATPEERRRRNDQTARVVSLFAGLLLSGLICAAIVALFILIARGP